MNIFRWPTVIAMNIVHISKVIDALEGKDEIIFVYRSIGTRDALMRTLHDAGYAWASGRSLLTTVGENTLHLPLNTGVRAITRSKSAYYGSEGAMRERYLADKFLRVVL